MSYSLGILGGLGPLASAEFLKTIYEFNVTELEQDSPTCILYSNPAFPDRTDTILSGLDDLLINLLVKSLQSLCQMGVSKLVIACVTIHYFLPRVPVSLREKVISLIDVILKEVIQTNKQYLLLCSNGTLQAGVFQKHADWSVVEPYILLPDNKDQQIIQSYIYQIKKNWDDYSLLNYIEIFSYKYKVDAFILGCTEFHFLNKYLLSREDKKQYQIVDPLITIAKNLDTFIKA